MTTTIEMLQRKFRETGYNTVTDWMKANDVDLSLQSCTCVLLRGQNKGLVVMLTLAAALKCSVEEMQAIAIEGGDKTLWRLITKESVTKEEGHLLTNFRTLNDEQRKNVAFMVKQLAAKE